MALAVTYTPYKPGTFDQGAPAPSATGEGSPDATALSAKIRALPEYAAFQREQSTTHQSMSGGGGPAQRALAAKISQMGVPDDLSFDMQSGQIRDKSWVASHPMLFRALVTGGFLAGGYALAATPGLSGAAAGGAEAGAGAGAAGAGAATGGTAALGPTTAASVSGTTAAVGGSTVPAALAPAATGATVAGGATTGGLGMNSYLQLAGAGTNLLGNYMQGKASEEQNAAQLAQRERELAAQQQRDAAIFNRANPSTRAHDSVRGDILSNVQPAAFTGSGRDLKLTGGLGPSLLSSSSRQLGADMTRKALLSQLGQGGANDPYADIGSLDDVVRRAHGGV